MINFSSFTWTIIIFKVTSDFKVLLSEINNVPLIDRLEIAFKVPPERLDNYIVYTTNDYRKGYEFDAPYECQVYGKLHVTP
jgi:hypothetical protein